MGIVKENLFYCNVSANRCVKISPEAINYYDLTFVLKGSLTYIIDGTKYILEENDAILLKPGAIRERYAGSTPVKYVSFNFLLNEPVQAETFMKGIINSEIRTLVSTFPQSHISPLYHSKEKTECILNYILYEIIDTSVFKSKNSYVVEILKYVENNLSQKLSLAQISAKVNLTKEYTATLFKKETGKTLSNYINERKMLAAKNMIDNEAISLRDVAYCLGFENYSYFSKVYKKYYATSPVKRKKG